MWLGNVHKRCKQIERISYKIDQQKVVATNDFNQLKADKAQLGVNFIKVLTRSFHAHRSQKGKKLLNLTVFLTLLGICPRKRCS